MTLVPRLATGTITFATLFLGQKHFTKQLKGMKTSNIALSSTLFSLTTSGSLLPCLI